MLKDERLEGIECYVNQKKYVSLMELTKVFNTSRATVRRDLQLLSATNSITLTRGGAVSNAKPAQAFRASRDPGEERERIARAAADFLGEGESVMLDTGDICRAAVRYFKDSNASVATTDLMTAVELVQNGFKSVFIIGGDVHGQSYTVGGVYASSFLRELRFDRAFLQVDSVGVEQGCNISCVEQLAIKRGILDVSREVVVLCEHHRFDTVAFAALCGLDRVSAVITGVGVGEKVVAAFAEAGKRLIVV